MEIDWFGVAAVIAALSGLVVAMTGIVVAFRVASPRGRLKTRTKTDKSTSETLPPNPPEPGG